ncbi:GNAT family N-acetyltransferase [Bryobacter aggregatus]|uniref:bifunctional acetate--CoA ligase family protein/GNAT family N-acetyltransferase n=1 Tax=Bryobacter aggregatus TaxID=360054 RepID=UPI0004E10608|nr:GNAT family N-acetyltransferase [Bryobacter aggregatus]
MSSEDSPRSVQDHFSAARKAGGWVSFAPESYVVVPPRDGVRFPLSRFPVMPGRVAFITQSNSLGASILDWAQQSQAGFSAFIALGRSPDIDFANCIDYLSEDPSTQSILLYLEGVRDASRFLSAARECALRKPVIVLKPGKRDPHRDAVFDAAFRRCGMLRVNRIADLFHLADVLERQPRPRGSRLSILTNANAPGLLAADALSLAGGELAALIDLGGSATTADYRQAINAHLKDPNCHGILTIVTPQPDTQIEEAARSLAEAAATSHKTLLASFMGGESMREARSILAAADIPNFPYADTAARAFQTLWQYSSSLNGLYETPMFAAEAGDVTGLAAQLEEQRPDWPASLLHRILEAYRLPVHEAESPSATRFTCRSEIDPTFGPVIFLSAHGLGESIYGDSIAALPPLTSTLARRRIEHLRLHRTCTPEALLALEAALVRFARLVSEVPVIRELRLDLAVDPSGAAWVSSVRATSQPAGLAPEHWPRCVIRPYPRQYEHPVVLRDGSAATIRPIRPEDESRLVDFHNDLSERSVYLRYLQFLKFEERISHERLARVVFNDYARELALVVEQNSRILGVGRMQRNPLRMEEAEVAFLVRDSAQGQGIGSALVTNLIDAARREGLRHLIAELLSDNQPMRRLLERAGFRMRLGSDGRTLLASLSL